MNLTASHPTITDMPGLLRDLAETLEEMHLNRQWHGAIHVAPSCLSGDQGKLDRVRFQQSRLVEPADGDEATKFRQDVHQFVFVCVNHITGASTEAGISFKASLYRGRGFSDAFLDHLEKVSAASYGAAPLGMRELREALANNTNAPAPDQSGGVALPAPSLPSVAAQPASAAPVRSKAKPTVVVRVALPNGTVGKPYDLEPGRIARGIAKQRGDDPGLASVVQLQLPDDLGLDFNKTTGALTGTPKRAFDGELHLDYAPSSASRHIGCDVTLIINPDPTTLWKDLPQPPDAPYQKPPSAHTEQNLGQFRILAASLRGRSHAHKGDFRDDDYAMGIAEQTGWLAVVVADGAGSAKYSRRGSQIACDTALKRILHTFDSVERNLVEANYKQHQDWLHAEVRNAMRKALYDAALDAHHAIDNEAKNPGESLPAPPTMRDYATTLILLVIKQLPAGYVLATFAIGDGGAGLMRHPSEGIPLTKPEGGDYGGQTVFLTMPETLRDTEEEKAKHFHMTTTPEFAAALLMTDGITDPKLPSDAAFADPAQWAGLWQELQPALKDSASLLEWMNFFSPGNHDDRTMVVISPTPLPSKTS